MENRRERESARPVFRGVDCSISSRVMKGADGIHQLTVLVKVCLENNDHIERIMLAGGQSLAKRA
jgi:hypothetical protein